MVRAARAAVRACLRAFVVASLAIVGAGGALAQPKGDAARGEARAAVCLACHGGPGAEPTEGSPILAGQMEAFLVLQQILIREGLRDIAPMAGLMKGLKDQDLLDIAAYFAKLAPPKNGRPRDAALYDRGAALSKGMGCGSCHLAGYRGQNQVPRIAGQREDYLATTLADYRDNRRTGTDTNMNGLMQSVTDADLKAIAHYLSHQP